MNKIANTFAIGASVLFVLGGFATAWYLIELPDYLMASSKTIDMAVAAEIKPLHTNILIVTISTLMIGLVALIAQAVSFKNQDANVVYVEKVKNTQQTAKLNDDDTESHDVSAMSEDLLSAIRQAAARNEHPDKKLEQAIRVVCNQLQASQGAVYVSIQRQEQRSLELRAGYALMKPDSQVIRYEYGEGLPGQVAKEGQSVNLNKVPDGYIKVLSGLGSASPKHLLLVPIRAGETIAGVVEIASFTPLTKSQEELVKQSFEIMGKIIDDSSQQHAAVQPVQEEDFLNEPIKR
ncbi:GAF domain-containing protein [Cesiribacter sp. SM1]|uniref:GAF domain-containing protein n=1 Tax=Cesiribacter sp. SM1 TaxID=2861196 RepID=UPI001CD2A599|nr:GAF domain-containing protein [Cesiribacter sp. SM1]